VKFWVSAQKPPGGHECAAKRCIRFCMYSRFANEPLGGDDFSKLIGCVLWFGDFAVIGMKLGVDIKLGNHEDMGDHEVMSRFESGQ